MLSDSKRHILHFMNIGLCLLHLCIGVVVIFILKDVQVNNVLTQLTGYNIRVQTIKDGSGKITNANTYTEEVVSLSITDIAWIIFAFNMVSAIAHGFYSVCFNKYVCWIEAGYNPIRWIEYTFSASLMTFILCVVSGVLSFDQWISLTFATAAMIIPGYVIEKLIVENINCCKKAYRDKRVLFSVLAGLILNLVIIFVILYNFSLKYLDIPEIPTYIWIAVISTLVFYSSFGFVMLAYMFFGGDYFYYELAYVTLSIFSKAFLAFFVAFGLKTRAERDI